MKIEVKIDTRSLEAYGTLYDKVIEMRTDGIPDVDLADALALLTAEVALKGFTGFEGPDAVIDEWNKCAYAVASEPKWGQE